ncbi:MAG: nucleotide exchange factor GrpE [bacterium]|nr:nucleotide exchange factor GrpE [bacterium]
MATIEVPQEGELEKLIKEKEEYLNGWKRAKADLINYQKDESVRAQEFMKIANTAILLDLIPILDSFDLAMAASQSDKSAAVIKSQFEEVLKRYGVEKISIELGKPLDTKSQESVGEMESSHPPGSVAEEVSKGYVMNGRVIRPAKVKVAK